MALEPSSQQEMIESLTFRLNKLQSTLAGPSDISQLQNMPFCALKMASRIQDQVSLFEAKWRNAKILSKRLDEMSDYLRTMDDDDVSEKSRAEVLIARTGEIHQQVRDYEHLEQLKEYAGGLPVDTSTLQTRVRPLIEVSLHQQEETRLVTLQVQEVVARYNTVISAISNQFLVLDELLTKLENGK